MVRNDLFLPVAWSLLVSSHGDPGQGQLRPGGLRETRIFWAHYIQSQPTANDIRFVSFCPPQWRPLICSQTMMLTKKVCTESRCFFLSCICFLAAYLFVSCYVYIFIFVCHLICVFFLWEAGIKGKQMDTKSQRETVVVWQAKDGIR